ncbi:MAG: hypothetical protein K8I30_07945 [Anaerolineae bacterium]|nr:hypothetical protein [Anaerolineae bacterium]
MQPITITTMLDENHELFLKVKLPDMPPGPVEVMIVPRPADQFKPGTREWTQAKLREAGLLAEDHYPDAIAVSEAELERLRQVFAGQRPLSEQIIEDREDRI